MSEIAYVNGHDQYRGNILLDPDGNPTRAEMYDAIAEVSRPVELEIPKSVESYMGLSVAALWFIALFTAFRLIVSVYRNK